MRVSDIIPALDGLPDAQFASTYKAIMAKAGQLGFRGFGGDCWPAAVAINRVIFNSKGTLIAGLNVPLIEAGIPIGHAAVLARNALWDADGVPKADDEVESWGMLDPHDPDYQQMFRRAKLEWNEDTASDAGMFEFDSEAEFLSSHHITEADVAPYAAILRRATE